MNDPKELEKSKIFDINEIIDYVPVSIGIKNVMKKNTGSVTIASFDEGQTMTEKTSPFDHFIQAISGSAEIMIRNQSFILESGQCIILPAHIRNTIRAIDKFKMISTVIKSGYEEAI
jgi:quercetin dioxygenase-like cupin family protein